MLAVAVVPVGALVVFLALVGLPGAALAGRQALHAGRLQQRHHARAGAKISQRPLHEGLEIRPDPDHHVRVLDRRGLGRPELVAVRRGVAPHQGAGSPAPAITAAAREWIGGMVATTLGSSAAAAELKPAPASVPATSATLSGQGRTGDLPGELLQGGPERYVIV